MVMLEFLVLWNFINVQYTYDKVMCLYLFVRWRRKHAWWKMIYTFSVLCMTQCKIEFTYAPHCVRKNVTPRKNVFFIAVKKIEQIANKRSFFCDIFGLIWGREPNLHSKWTEKLIGKWKWSFLLVWHHLIKRQ